MNPLFRATVDVQRFCDEEIAPLPDLKGTTEALTRLERLLASARAPDQ